MIFINIQKLKEFVLSRKLNNFTQTFKILYNITSVS